MWVCLLVVAALIGVPADPPPTVYEWAAEKGGGHAFHGITGYVSQTPTATVTGPHVGHASWLALCASDPCRTWVQIGLYQGMPPRGPAAADDVHAYLENRVGDCVYEFRDLGVPPADNVALSIVADGTRRPDGCAGPLYRYEFRIAGTVVGHGWLPTPDGWPEAASELHHPDRLPAPPIVGDWFGCDDAHTPDARHGLRLATRPGGGWRDWTTTTDPGATRVSYDPPRLTPLGPAGDLRSFEGGP